MNKGELIDAVAAELKTTKAEAARAVEAVIETITKGVKKQDKVAIAGFGTFVKRRRAGRNGINPFTKEPIKIGPSKTCGFKPAPAFKEAL
jgi:DNA-binding protein HU-beta